MTRRLIRWAAIVQLAALFALLSCSPVFAADGPAPGLTLNERVYVASRIYASLDNFAHWQNVPDMDVEAAYRTYLDKAIASEDRRAFSLASMEFLAGFHNAHTVFMDQALVQQGGALPFVAQSVHGQWVVTESMSPDLKPGEVIESIDGRTFEQFVQDSSRLIAASTEAGRRHVLFARMPGFSPYAHLFPEQFVQDFSRLIAASTETGRRPVLFARVPGFSPYARLFPEQFVQDSSRLIAASTEAGRRHVLFARMPGFSPYAYLFPEQFVLTLSAGRKVAIDRRALQNAPLATEGRWLEPAKVAYIRIRTFMGPDFEKRALELAKEYRSAQVLIVDVRGNPGGNTPGELTSFLMDRPSRWWTESTPVVMPLFRYNASKGNSEYQPFNRPELLWTSPVQQPAKDVFTGKLAILADAGCFSACEDFLMAFKDNHRALIVGETTGGSSGQPYMLDLGKGMMIMVGAKREMFPDGSRFEGVGIKADLEVGPTLEDLLAGNDTVLGAPRQHLVQ